MRGGVADELADSHLALSLRCSAARLGVICMLLLELELGASSIVDASSSGTNADIAFKVSRLTGAGTAGDEDVQLARLPAHAGTGRPSERPTRR
jgi:hypothetical protein